MTLRSPMLQAGTRRRDAGRRTRQPSAASPVATKIATATQTATVTTRTSGPLRTRPTLPTSSIRILARAGSRNPSSTAVAWRSCRGGYARAAGHVLPGEVGLRAHPANWRVSGERGPRASTRLRGFDSRVLALPVDVDGDNAERRSVDVDSDLEVELPDPCLEFVELAFGADEFDRVE